MNRRNFLKTLGAVGFATSLPWVSNSVQAANLHTGKILLTLNLGGGWDHSSFSDPRNNPLVNRWANTQVAGEAGNLRYAPMAENAAFFNKYQRYMLVVNGIDIQTNGHEAAERNRNTGNLMQGYPSLNELYAAVAAPTVPMPFVRDGGFSETAGIMPFTVLPDETLLRTLANPNYYDATRSYYANSHVSTLQRFRDERLQAQVSQPNNLPRWQEKLDELQRARAGTGDMNLLGTVLSGTLDRNDLQGQARNGIQNMHLFLTLAAAGMTATGCFSTGGFDTHGNHDTNHANALINTTRLLDYLWTKAEGMGLADRLVVHVTSDVGRTPSYNAGNGKDHWSLGSDIIMAKNAPWANRIVGISGATHEKRAINPNTLQLSESGVQLQPRHVQAELRKLLGIDTHALAQRYDLKAESMALFNPAVSSGITV
ncbi:MAG: hypothetical protein BWK73_19775 [Thiothrix lacustris]|uniref:Tat pathway signal protein n=1 Tax=Thiothrix lacustris TaxID=525917 RepID=A0A1Y1QPC0_9GAMM|nr:MAG: hypothetical protein BWK73_19775 [Thiothrix lacustris]